MAYKMKDGFLPLPGGETRNITVNGTIRPYQTQDRYSNGFMAKGNLSTQPDPKPQKSKKRRGPSYGFPVSDDDTPDPMDNGGNTNRSGEKGNYGF